MSGQGSHERWQTARDLKDELLWIAQGPVHSKPPDSSAPVSVGLPVKWILSVALAAVAALAIYFALSHRQVSDVPNTRFMVTPPENSTLALVNVGGPISVSPDGRQLVFVAATSDGKHHLWVRSLDTISARMLTATDDAAYPFWSPDARFVGFFADGKLKKTAVSGGPPQVLADAPNGRGGSWSHDDVILFSPHAVSGLYRLAASGGEPVGVTALDAGRNESGHSWPRFLPDGRKFIYYAFTDRQETSGVYLGSLESKQGRLLLSTASNAVYAPPRDRDPAYLLFARGTTLLAQPLDSEMRFAGEPSPVGENLGYYEGFPDCGFPISDNGVLAYGSGLVYPPTQLVWFDRQGKQLGSVGTPGNHTTPRLSPNQKRIAVGEMYGSNNRGQDRPCH